MSEDIKELTDFNMYIDISKECESLKLEGAASIILYELDK